MAPSYLASLQSVCKTVAEREIPWPCLTWEDASFFMTSPQEREKGLGAPLLGTVTLHCLSRTRHPLSISATSTKRGEQSLHPKCQGRSAEEKGLSAQERWERGGGHLTKA